MTLSRSFTAFCTLYFALSLALYLLPVPVTSSSLSGPSTNASELYQVPVAISKNETGYVHDTNINLNESYKLTFQAIATGLGQQLQSELFNATSILYEAVYRHAISNTEDLRATPDLQLIMMYYSGGYALPLDTTSSCFIYPAAVVSDLLSTLTRKIQGPLNVTQNGTFLISSLNNTKCLSGFDFFVNGTKPDVESESTPFVKYPITNNRPRLRKRFFWLIVEFLVGLLTRILPQLITAIVRVASMVLQAVGSFALRSAMVIANAIRSGVSSIISGSSSMFEAIGTGARVLGEPIQRIGTSGLTNMRLAASRSWTWIAANKWSIAFEVGVTGITSAPFSPSLSGADLLTSSLIAGSFGAVTSATGLSVYSGVFGQDSFENYKGEVDKYSQSLIDNKTNSTSVLYENAPIAAISDSSIPNSLIQGAYTTSLLLNLLQAQDQSFKLILLSPAFTVDMSYMAAALADFSLKYSKEVLCLKVYNTDTRQGIIDYLAGVYAENMFLDASFQALKVAWMSDLQQALGYYRNIMPFVLKEYETLFNEFKRNLGEQFQYPTYGRLAQAAVYAFYDSSCI